MGLVLVDGVVLAMRDGGGGVGMCGVVGDRVLIFVAARCLALGGAGSCCRALIVGARRGRRTLW